MVNNLLEAKELVIEFGGLQAVSNVDIEIAENELVGLIGPNGAGKTTIFNLLTGVYKPTSGQINLKTNKYFRSIVGLKPYKIVAMGISRTFQNIRLFKELTVLDNVLVAMNAKYPESLRSVFFRLPKFYKTEQKLKRKAFELLEMFELSDSAYVSANNLPYGKARRLEIVRALATEPKLLFLDEPAAGMNPSETAELTKLIKLVQEKFGISILLIEHDMSLVMDICERIYVLEYGKLISVGTPAEVSQDPKVIAAYLGSGE